MKVSKLKYNPNNPRRIAPAQLERLKKSIKDFPEMMEPRPMVYDPATMQVLGGNQRLAAIKSLDMTDIPDTWAVPASALTDAQKKEFILKDNIPLGEWDFAVLESDFAEFELGEIGIEVPDGFGSDDPEATEDDYEQPEQIDTDIKLGDLFSLRKDGKEIHRLLCGDATKKEDVDRLMDGAKADMVFTDPPYGLGGYGGRNNMRLQNDDGDDDLIKSFYNLPLYATVGEVYLWCNASVLRKHIVNPPKDVIVWVKNNFGLGKGYRGQYEMCLYYGQFSGSDSDVWYIDKDSHYEHPTQKPVALAARAIENSKPNAVIDCFLGSGSTMVACHQLDRKCWGMEIEPTYCQVTLDRMRKLDPDFEVVKIDG